VISRVIFADIVQLWSDFDMGVSRLHTTETKTHGQKLSEYARAPLFIDDMATTKSLESLFGGIADLEAANAIAGVREH
jgi:hypothetical protein